MFAAARRAACRSSCTPISSPTHGAALAAEFGALSADHLEYLDEAGVAAMARAASSRCCCRALSISCARPGAAGGSLAQARRAMAVATDCNPGTSPLTSLLLALNMAATLFGLTVDECLAGATRNAARALGPCGGDRHPRSRQVGRSRDLGHRAAGRAGLPDRLQSAACARLERPMTVISGRARCRSPSGARSGAGRGGRRSLQPRGGGRQRRGGRAHRRARRAGLRRQHRLRQTGELRIAPADLGELQRNIVLSHSAGVGEPRPSRRRG